MKQAGELRAMKERGEKIAMLTAYDYPMARLLEESAIDVILVGDSLGMVVLGFPDTTSVTMEHMLHHTAAVARGAQRSFIVSDMPYASYQAVEPARENAQRFVDAGAHAVKLEGGAAKAAEIEAITRAGIAVMAHIGMLPQSVRQEGGYKTKGVSEAEADALLEDARAVEKAGAFAVVLELVQEETAARITRELTIPTIGIGSGAACDGQVLVTHDLIGLFPWFKPRFVSRAVHVGEEIRAAAAQFARQTKGG